MGRELPRAMQERSHEIRTFMPKWGTINERRGQLHEVQRLSGMNLIINDTDHPLIIKVASIPSTRVQVYFIDNDDYFTKRQMTVDEMGNDYPDNGERAIFFARSVLETVTKQRWSPDIIHCQGWMSAVIPFYVKTAYHEEPSFANTKVVTSLFNAQPTCAFDKKFKQSIVYREATADLMEKYGDNFDFMELGKLAVDYSDAIVKTNDAVSEELMSYAAQQEKPILSHPTEDKISEDYSNFYEQILG